LWEQNFSTKGKRRGLGLVNLLEIVGSLPNVTLETEIEGGVFVQKLIIEEPSPKRELFQINSGGSIKNFPVDKIMFFETHPNAHRLVLHLENGRVEFRGSLNEVEKASDCFFRCHMAYVVNTKNIKSIDKVNRTIEAFNGERLLVSRSKMKGLLSIIES